MNGQTKQGKGCTHNLVLGMLGHNFLFIYCEMKPVVLAESTENFAQKYCSITDVFRKRKQNSMGKKSCQRLKIVVTRKCLCGSDKILVTRSTAFLH